ncbi:MAG: urease accessory protein UreE [Rhodospirillaceae bacterium]|nr:urease accessory protein UreE [Rhodospirillaceae bacterium]
MRRAIEHRLQGYWPEEAAVGSVSLTFDDRHRRRLRLITTAGESVLLDLPKAVAMAEGDGLRCVDNAWIGVAARPEPVLRITAATPELAARLAWHLGNRHTPADIRADAILIRPDHVLAQMLRGQGGCVTETTEPFQPEGGAYSGRRHRQDHSDGHRYA